MVSGQQNVAVPVSSTIQLVYDAAVSDDKVLDTKTSPGACAASASDTAAGGDAVTAVGGVKAGNDDEAQGAEENDVAVQGTKAGSGDGLLAATGSGAPLVGTAALGLVLLIGGAVLIAAPERLTVARGQHRRS